MATNLTKTTFDTTYKDDFSDSDNYHKILFNSGRILQARELTQAQTILQKQIERFGNNIFVEGAMVKAGGIVVNNSFEFIKLDTTSNALPSDTSTLVGTEFTSQDGNNIKAVVLRVEAASGSDPATLYVKYSFTSGALPGTTTIRMPDGVNINNGSVTLTTASSSAAGTGTIIHVKSGIFYAKGHFVFTDNQSFLASKYTDTFTGIIGFKVVEDIVTSDDDTDLFDNQGAVANTAAPGADRYRIQLTLINKANIVSNESFIFLIEMRDGGVVNKLDEFNPYNVPSQVVAQRIKENSGDYVVNQFKAKFVEDSQDTHLLLKISDGVAVVDGYRIKKSPTEMRVAKSTSTYTENNEFIAAEFGNFVKVSSAVGNTNGLPDLDTFEQLDIQDSADFHGGSTAKLGTARVRAISEDGANYRYHLFDINIDNGKSFRNAKSIGSDSDNWFNIIQENSQAVLHEATKNDLIFPLSLSRPASITDVTLTVQKFDTVTISGNSGTIGASSGLTYTNAGDWVLARSDTDSDVYTGTITLANSSTGNFTVSPGVPNGTYEIASYVQKTGTAKEKRLTQANVTRATASDTESDGNGLLFLKLAHADIFSFDEIKDSANGNIGYAGRFLEDNGQRDNFYDIGRLVLKGGQSMPTGNVYVSYKFFDHVGTGDFFSVGSYDSDGSGAGLSIGGYEKIPGHKFASGGRIALVNALDFRPAKNTSGVFTTANRFRLPQPNDLITVDAKYYLQKAGKIVLDNRGIIQFIEGDTGLPADKFPELPENSIGLFDVILGANTLNDSDVFLSQIENKRFTMSDISLLERRIDRLEEATTLTLLEMDTKNFQVLDSAGLARTRSGFMTDNFEDQMVSDIHNEDYRASIDPFSSFLHPAFHEDNVRLVFDAANSTNVVKKGDNVYLTYDSDVFLDASKASTSIIVNPFDFAQFRATLKLSPSSDEWRDVETIAGKAIDGGIQLDTKQAYLWDNHSWNWNGKAIADLKIGSRTSNVKNKIFNKVVADEKIREVVGERIIDTTLIPFMRQKKIYFRGDGLRPNTQHFAFFDREAVPTFVREETFIRYADDPTDYGNRNKNITSHPEGSSLLVSDSDGTIEGSFFVPGQRFRTGTREMHLLDVTAFNRDNARSVAVATFVSAGLLDTNEQDIKTTRKITIKQERIVEQPPRRQQSDDGGGRGPQFTFADNTTGYSGVRYTKEGGKWVKERALERGGGKFSGNTIGEAYRNNTRDVDYSGSIGGRPFGRN